MSISTFRKGGFMSQTPVFSGSLDNGLKYDVHALSGFAGHAEIAITINGRTATIVSIDENRAGHNVKVVQTNKFRLLQPNQMLLPERRHSAI
jgi:hypothetical protein